MDEKAKAEARILFADFNRWRLQTGSIAKRRAEGGFIRPFKETPERLELFAQTAKWCREREIDPRLWIYLLFRARMWTWSPQMEPHHLMSEAMAKRYPKLSERALDGYRQQLNIGAKKAKKFDPNWQISVGVEQLKKRYAANGDFERCMRETIDNTLGFHPKSSTCSGCPVRFECAQQLAKLVDFDILALRRGDITPEQAKEQAAAK